MKKKIESISLNQQEIISNGQAIDELTIRKGLQEYLKKELLNLLGDPTKAIALDMNVMDLGLSSAQLVTLTQKLEREIQLELYPTLFFEYPNLKELTDFFIQEHQEGCRRLVSGNSQSLTKSPDTKNQVSSEQEIENLEQENIEGQFTLSLAEKRELPSPKDTGSHSNDIAIIGMSGQFAESETLEEFWEHLDHKRDLITEVPLDHWDYRPWFNEDPEAKNMTYCKWGSFLKGIDQFDAPFFNISRREAEWIDPQLRLLLQSVYATSEHAGYANRMKGTNTGVFVGVCSHDYNDRIHEMHLPMNPFVGVGTTQTVFANRISFLFDFKGPSLAIDTACSSSLFALHLACQALHHKECTMAFVGGTNLLLSSEHYRYFSSIKALSPTGHCYSFDAAADGYVPGECVASVMLKPLKEAEKDGDRIHGVIKGSMALHGGYTPSLTAPSIAGEKNVLIKAWENAGIDPESISYIEAHGTGTKLGDPIEINALKKAFEQFTDKKAFCAIGSAKATIGHTEGAAGIAGLLKVIMQMKHQKIPAMPHFKQLNPYISLEKSALYINQDTIGWKVPPGHLRRAGVSSFGFSGAYAHMVVEEYEEKRSVKDVKSGVPAMIVLSTRRETSLRNQAGRILESIERQGFGDNDLSDIAYTLQLREPMDERLAFVSTSVEQLKERLREFVEKGKGSDLYRGSKEGENETVAAFQYDEELQEALQKWMAKKKFNRLSDLWVKGMDVEWHRLSEDPHRQRYCLNLPTYPFEKQRYWIGDSEPSSSNATAELQNVKQHTQVKNTEVPEKVSIEKYQIHLSDVPFSTTVPNVPNSKSETLELSSVEKAGDEVEHFPIKQENLEGARKLLEKELMKSLADALYLQEEEVGRDRQFVNLGLDSILGVEWVNTLNKKYGLNHTSNLLYEYPTIHQLAAHLIQEIDRPSPVNVSEIIKENTLKEEKNEVEGEKSINKAQVFREHMSSDLVPKSKEIAIVSLAGSYPGADSVEDFWISLCEGRDLVTEVPKERWDHDHWFNEATNPSNKKYCRWGGFINGVDEFDPLFFNISPREAETMDPKERLFLQTVWELFESAGYTRERLKREKKVGVFAGAMYQQYALFKANGMKESATVLAGSGAMVNRVSTYFDLKGPSIAVDTMCSSAATAIHLACESLLKGECHLAVAGGVNLSIHPKKYMGLSLTQMLTSERDRRSFSQGDGFIPAEAVGAVLLKPLENAETDGDSILAVIKSTAIAHRGASVDGFAVPDEESQYQLLKSHFEQARIDPITISYIEAAANGSPLSDVVEIRALKRVFEEESKRSIAVGAVKSNMGHAEAASAMSQLTKVVFQLQHKKLVPTIKSEPLNADIDFDRGPLHLQKKYEEWQLPQGKSGPRRASLSSFGAGGSHVHMILEEYLPTESKDASEPRNPSEFIVLSARNKTALKRIMNQLAHFLRKKKDMSLYRLAYTLQLRKEAMEVRWAVAVSSIDELILVIEKYLSGEHDNSQMLSYENELDSVEEGVDSHDAHIHQHLADALKNRDWQTVGPLWVKGAKIDWKHLYPEEEPTMMPLPVYPFEKRKCWLTETTNDQLLERKNLTLEEGDKKLLDEEVVKLIARLVGIPAEEMNRKRPLREYGFDSLVSLQLLQQLQGRYVPMLTGDKLFNCRTTQEVLDCLAEETVSLHEEEISVDKTRLEKKRRPHFPELIALNDATEGRPVFWFHAGLGGVETYMELAKCSKRPFFGIQARGFMTDRTPLHGIQAMVAYYIHMIQSVQPEGPYDFGGYSFGGSLAFEATRQLQELGQQVRSIVMCDTHDSLHMKRVNTSYKSELLQTMNTMLGAMIAQDQDLDKYFNTLIHRDELNLELSDEQFLQQLVALANERGLNKTASQLQVMLKQNARVQKAYEIDRFYVYPLLDKKAVECFYFRNKSGQFWGKLEPYNVISSEETPLDDTRYWGEWEEQFDHFHIIDVDAFSHLTLLTEPHVLKSILEFCERFYSGEPLSETFLAAYKKKTLEIHGKMSKEMTLDTVIV